MKKYLSLLTFSLIGIFFSNYSFGQFDIASNPDKINCDVTARFIFEGKCLTEVRGSFVENGGTLQFRDDKIDLTFPCTLIESNTTTNITLFAKGFANLDCAPFEDSYTFELTPSQLGIELVDFYGKMEDNQARLTWITASETENDFFTLERSKDGLNYFEIEKIAGSGTSNNTNRYDYFDENAYLGVSYYRLKQTDFDGSFAYSWTITLINEQTKADITSIYPNPAISTAPFHVDFYSPNTQEITLQIYSLVGKQMLDEKVELAKGLNTLNVNIDHLRKGFYLVKIITSDDRQIAYKFIVSK